MRGVSSLRNLALSPPHLFIFYFAGTFLTVTKIILLGAVAAVEAEQSEGACRQQEAPLSTLQFKERVPLAHNQPASQPASQSVD